LDSKALGSPIFSQDPSSSKTSRSRTMIILSSKSISMLLRPGADLPLSLDLVCLEGF